MNKSILYRFVLFFFIFSVSCFVSCEEKNGDDNEITTKGGTYVITAELVSIGKCPADFSNYVKSLCNSVYKNVHGNDVVEDKRIIAVEFDIVQTEIMQKLLKYDYDYTEKNYNIAFLAKDTSGELRFKRLMVVGAGRIQNNDYEY